MKPEPVEANETRPTSHTLLEATTLAGAAAGAVLGAAGGPPGMVVGGVIGTAIGMLAGTGLEAKDARQAKRDHELDDEIGVTSGSLGARDQASAGLTAMEAGARDDGQDFGAASAVLRQDHERLEVVYRALVEAYRAGDWNDVRAQWAVVEGALRAHLDNEEDNVFPAFLEVNPVEATALLAEHTELRKLLSTIGVAVELHAVPAGDIDVLLARIRGHAERESFLLYPWMDRGVSPKAV